MAFARRAWNLAAVAALVSVASCSSDLTTTDAGPAVQFLIVSGDHQVGVAGQELPQAVRVQATDANGQPVADVVVNFVVTAGGGSVFAGSALTDASGMAADVWTLGPTPGTPQPGAGRWVEGLGGMHVSGTCTAFASAAPPSAIQPVDGDGQSAPVNTTVAIPPAVVVVDQNGTPVPGQAVSFTVASGGGTLTGGAATTDSVGVARVGSWTLGPTPGPNTLVATSPALPGLQVTFTATGTGSGTPAAVQSYAGDGQSAAVGTTVATAPAVLVLDQNGAPVAGESVTFVVASGGGSITGASATTDGQGVAHVGSWTLGSAVGTNTLTATAASLPGNPITFTATGVAATGTLGVAVAPPATVQNALVFGTAPKIQLEDAGGSPLAVGGVTVTASVVGTGAFATGTITAVTDGAGLATFDQLSITGQVGSYQLSFDASGFGPVQTAAISLTAGLPTSVAQSAGDAQSVNAGTPVPVAPAVLVSDVSGNPVPGASVTFAVVLGGGSVVGGVTTTNVAGVGQVGSWTLGPLSGPNGLSATVAGLVGSSVTFSANGLGNFWTNAPALPAAGLRFPEGGVINGLLYLAGGRQSSGLVQNTLWSFDPATGAWATHAPMPTARHGAQAAVVNGILYVAGGTTSTGAVLATVEAYDPATDSWSTKAPMPEARVFGAAASLNGLLYVAGGNKAGGALASVYSYDPATNTWTPRASLPEARPDLVATSLNGKIYVAGGAPVPAADGALLAYDPNTDSWTRLPPMPTIRYHVAVEAVNGQIYVISGIGKGLSYPLPTVEAFDPTTSTWTSRAPVQTPRYGAVSGTVNGLVFLSAGAASSGPSAVNEKYVP